MAADESSMSPLSDSSGGAARAVQRIEALERENRELAAKIDALQGSLSWRVTKPLRGALRLLRGRSGPQMPAAAPPTPDLPQQAFWVLDTGLFDPDFYKKAAGLPADLSDIEAAAHYATIGEARRLPPGPEFDTEFYAEANPDLIAESMGLLVHFAHWGRQEGRIGRFDGEARMRPGGKPFDPAKPTMLLACHEASRTGAPILGWNLARHLATTHNLVVVVLKDAGDLFDIFVAEAVLSVGPFKPGELGPTAMRRCVESVLARYRLDHALVNSIECQPLLAGLAALHVPSVTLVHEFPSNVYPPGRMTNGLMLSSQVVFDAEVQRRAALDDWPGITTRSQHVFHQGASLVPPAPPRPGVAPPDRTAKRAAVEAAVRGKAGVPVVLGLGTIAMRKGIDLFVSCAQVVAARRGIGAVRFVWIGHAPNPHPEGHYVDWVKDQIKRGGLDRMVVILDEVDDLSGAFAACDAVLVSSRLDPFPNVAMDAALAGVPVLCFDRANGFAEFLQGDAATAELVLPYLDVGSAATRILALIDDPARHAAIGAALRERSTRDFAMQRYIEKLQPVIAAAKAVTAQERRDIERLCADETFSAFLWLGPFERLSREEAIRLHVRKAASGHEAAQYCRRPALGFVPQIYADHRPELKAEPFENPLAHWIGAGKPEGPWTHDVLVAGEQTVAGGQTAAVRGLRVALHLHIFYPELLDDILAAILVNATLLDLLISTDTEAKGEVLRKRLADYTRGSVTLRICPNRGRDIGPMLTCFGADLQHYDVIGHFHGKRSLALTTVGLGPDLGIAWHAFLTEHLLGPRFPMIDLILARFAAEPCLGLVFPEDPNLTGWSLDRDVALDLAARMDPAMRVPQSIDFPIGTMFWARPKALKPLFDLGLGWDDYPPEPVPIDGTMLHALERLLPVICGHCGFDITTTHVPGVSR